MNMKKLNTASLFKEIIMKITEDNWKGYVEKTVDHRDWVGEFQIFLYKRILDTQVQILHMSLENFKNKNSFTGQHDFYIFVTLQ